MEPEGTLMIRRRPGDEEPENHPAPWKRDTILLTGTGLEVVGWMTIIIGIVWVLPPVWVAGIVVSLAAAWVLYRNRKPPR